MYVICMFMYVRMVTHIARVWIKRERLPIVSVVSWAEKWIFTFPRSRLRILSREIGSTVPSHMSLLISVLGLNLMLTYYGILPSSAAASIYYLF